MHIIATSYTQIIAIIAIVATVAIIAIASNLLQGGVADAKSYLSNTRKR